MKTSRKIKSDTERLKKPRLHLRRSEAPAEGLQSIALLQLQSAIAELKGNNVSPEPVHNARTYIKKTRAIIQLAAPALPKEHREKLYSDLREASGRLSPLRDSEVQVETLDLILESNGFDPKECSGIRAGLADIAKQRRINDARNIPKVIATLKKTLAAVSEWPSDSLDGKDLIRRVRRVYRRGRTTLELCSLNDDPELFHTWRKLLKQLWYSLRVTVKFWPDDSIRLIEELELIGESAGKERDLALLAETLKHGPKNQTSARILQAIGEKIPKLRKKAIDDGLRFYEPKPKAFTAVMNL
jgi:CHAD domain-containing protein